MPVSDPLVPVVPPGGASHAGGDPVSPLDGGRGDGGGGRRPAGGAWLSAQPVPVNKHNRVSTWTRLQDSAQPAGRRQKPKLTLDLKGFTRVTFLRFSLLTSQSSSRVGALTHGGVDRLKQEEETSVIFSVKKAAQTSLFSCFLFMCLGECSLAAMSVSGTTTSCLVIY